jgi:small subunit ribosomal protein S20
MTIGYRFDNICDLLIRRKTVQNSGVALLPAQKAARRSVKRYARNMSIRRTTRSAIGQARRALASGDAESEAAVSKAMSLLDIAVRKGVFHKNNASRRKARLAAALNRSQSS